MLFSIVNPSRLGAPPASLKSAWKCVTGVSMARTSSCVSSASLRCLPRRPFSFWRPSASFKSRRRLFFEFTIRLKCLGLEIAREYCTELVRSDQSSSSGKWRDFLEGRFFQRKHGRAEFVIADFRLPIADCRLNADLQFKIENRKPHDALPLASLQFWILNCRFSIERRSAICNLQSKIPPTPSRSPERSQ